MNLHADLCPSCRKRGVIATTGGPTCPHGAETGAKWFPDWWHVGPFNPENERRRCDWLTAGQNALAIPQAGT